MLILAVLLPAADRAVPPKPSSPVGLRNASEFVLAVDINEEPYTFNPQKSTNIHSAHLFTAIAEGLVSYHPATLNPVPGAATRITTSEDGRKWTITIRDDARFSNGDPITAYTFEQTFFHLISSESNSDMASLLDVVAGVRSYRTGVITERNLVGIRAEDASTLTLQLITPAPYLLDILCHHSFAPVHPSNLTGLKSVTADSFISSGPYTIETMTDEMIYLKKNPYYWDHANVSSETVRIELRKTGLDLLIDFSGEMVHWSEAYIPINLLYSQDNVVVYPEYSTSFFYFSENSGPYSTEEVRKALALLVPWEELRGREQYLFPTETLVPQDTAYNGVTGIAKADRKLAMELLEQAGYPEGFGLPPIHIAIHPGRSVEEITDRITDIWSRELGIMVITDVVPFSVYLDDPAQSPYTMAYITWIADFYDPYSFLNLWLSDSNFNLGKYQNPEYDALIRHGLEQDNDTDRFVYFREAEGLLLNQAAVIPIAHGVSVNFVNNHIVSGWYPNLLDIHPFKYFDTHEPEPGQSGSM
jgi:oligopeptide transport system substrate-binding protein